MNISEKSNDTNTLFKRMTHYEHKEEEIMDFLQYGMDNEKSESPLKRTLAAAALKIADMEADVYDAYLRHLDLGIPENPCADAWMRANLESEIRKLEHCERP